VCWLRGFVRAFVIELVAEQGEALLLGGPGAARWSRGFGFEGFMHALVPAVLVGAGRFNQFGCHA
jgi:hypothetical protein